MMIPWIYLCHNKEFPNIKQKEPAINNAKAHALANVGISTNDNKSGAPNGTLNNINSGVLNDSRE
jgi:hypothetical protein